MSALGAAMPSVGPYCSASRVRVRGDVGHDRGEVLGRERRGVGQPAGQRDHLGTLGDRHEVAHGRGLHDLRAAREQPRVPLEVVARSNVLRTAGFRSVVRHGRPRSLSSIVMRPDGSGPPMKLLLDLSRAPAPRRPSAIRPFLPALVAGAVRQRRPRHRLRRHGVLVPRGAAGSCRAARRPARRVHRPGAGGSRPGPVERVLTGIAVGSARWCAPARSTTASASGGRASSSGRPARCSAAWSSPTLLGRVRRRLDDDAAARAAPLRRAARARARRRLRAVPAAGPRRHRPPALSCCSAAAGARARSTRACASCVEPRPSSSSPSSTGSSRPSSSAPSRTGRAPALGALMERGDLRRRVRRRVPVGHPGLRGDDRHRASAGRPPHRRDELVLTATRHATSSTARASPPPAASGSPGSSPTSSTT